MLSDIQEKILLIERKKLLEQISQRDEIIEWLIDQLEEEHSGERGKIRAYIFANWDLQY